MIPHAQVVALPRARGEGRFRQSVAANSRQSALYSSFRYVWLKESVSQEISSKCACISLSNLL